MFSDQVYALLDQSAIQSLFHTELQLKYSLLYIGKIWDKLLTRMPNAWCRARAPAQSYRYGLRVRLAHDRADSRRRSYSRIAKRCGRRSLADGPGPRAPRLQDVSEISSTGLPSIVNRRVREHFNTTPPPNACYAQRLLLDMGVPAEHILKFAESRTLHSFT